VTLLGASPSKPSEMRRSDEIAARFELFPTKRILNRERVLLRKFDVPVGLLVAINSPDPTGLGVRSVGRRGVAVHTGSC